MNRILMVLLLIVFSTPLVHPQKGGRNTTWLLALRYTNTGYQTINNSFGTGIDYTFCLDTSSNLPYPEIEIPPTPCSCVDARFYMDITGSYGCLGQGVFTNIHAGSFTETVTDTFEYQIEIADRDNSWYIMWDTADIHKKLNSVIMQDASGGSIVDVDMMTTDSIEITNTSPAKNVNQFHIYATWKPIDSTYNITDAADHQTGNALPVRFALKQNYPNPFNPSTVISYDLPTRELVSLKIYNILGQEVASLVNGVQEPGYKAVKFTVADLPSGVYMYRLTAGTFIATRKMLLLR